MKNTRNLQNDARHALGAYRRKKESYYSIDEEMMMTSLLGMTKQYETLKHSPMGDVLTRD